jgi:protein-disulfide isomerase
LRNLLTAIAAVAIIGVAGAVYFVSRDRPAPTPSATTAANTSPDASAQPASPSAPAPNASGTDTSTAGTSTAPATPSTTPPSATTGESVEPTSPSATPQVAVAPPPPDVGADEHVLGKADAPVTIIEYASMTCPHCAKWDVDVMPRIKSEFIDKGLVRFVFRPFPLDIVAARASMMAQCAPAEGYFGMVDVLFRSQNDWARASDPLAALKQIGRTAGLSSADIDRCIADEAALTRLVDGNKEANAKFGVDSTPSFIINGKKYTNIPYFDDYQEEGATKPGFGTVIRNLLPKS